MTTPRPSAPEKTIHEDRSFWGSDLLDPVHEYIFPDKFYIRNTLVICVFISDVCLCVIRARLVLVDHRATLLAPRFRMQ